MTNVTFSALDFAGNTGSAQATVTVTDQTEPVITLTGSNSVIVSVGDTYSDQGATATDNVDGDMTSSIQLIGSVDANSVGIYTTG